MNADFKLCVTLQHLSPAFAKSILPASNRHNFSLLLSLSLRCSVCVRICIPMHTCAKSRAMVFFFFFWTWGLLFWLDYLAFELHGSSFVCHPPRLEKQVLTATFSFYKDAWDLNSSPYPCVANLLFTEPSPQPINLYFWAWKSDTESWFLFHHLLSCGGLPGYKWQNELWHFITHIKIYFPGDR